jgi:tetratricopeptide (TPR) repeat protein
LRVFPIFLLASTTLVVSPAYAADALKFGAAPSWVRPQSIPAAKASTAPIELLLADQQVEMQTGKTISYSDEAVKFVTAQGLAAGNLSIVWQPATDTVTVNKVHILRGGKVIDVLAAGQTFTVLRRETNLDAATLDGALTATLQPEGLQVGDIIELATTTERSDPVLKGHVETSFAAWNGVPVQQAHALLRWPAAMHLQVRTTPNLPAPRKSSEKGLNILEWAAQDVQPIVAPKDAPVRFKVGRLGEATDYSAWSDLAATFIPLFREASQIPSAGPLHDEVEKIRAASSDPKVRAEQALALVQDRVRYVALLMGQGGYVPASAETTWSRRFGDCKAKTALLAGILHSLGIEAEPVLVQSDVGDMIADRLPMVSLFDHVLVRAHIAGKDYWLDGTRTGDANLDLIRVPNFGWGLPLTAGAKLVQMVPAPLASPNLDRRLSVDASHGIYAPAPFTIEESYVGDEAVTLNTIYSSLSAEQRDLALHDEAKAFFDDFTVNDTAFDFDPRQRKLKITVKGTTTLNWKDGWFYVPKSSLAFEPDLDRPTGPLHDVPLAISHPRFIRDTATLKLPPGFAAQQKINAPVQQTLAGVEYARTETVNGDTLTVESSERSLVPEVAYKDALAAAPRLRAISKDDVYLSSNVGYAPSARDVAELPKQTPSSANDYIDRGNLYLDGGKFDEAVADFTKALELNPKDVNSLSDRALAYTYKGAFEAADKDLAAAAALKPDSAGLNRARGLYFERKGDFKAAIAAFSTSLTAAPSNGFALEHRALLELQLGQVDAAIADVDRGLKDNPDSLRLRLIRARVHAFQGKKEDAAQDLAEIEKKGPLDDQTAAMVGSVYQMLGMQDRGKSFLQQSIQKSDPEDARSIARNAMIEFQMGKLDDALAQSSKALEMDPHLEDLRVVRANILYMRRDRAAVAAEARSLTAQNPKSEYAFVAAGKIYHQLGLDAEAFKAFDRAIAINPKPYVYVNREQIRPKTDIKNRLADLDTALKIEPGNADALIAKSAVLSDNADYAGALAVLEAVPASAQLATRSQRGFLLAKAGRLDEAKKLFEEARATITDPSELNNLCYAKASAAIMLDSALEDCRKALEMSPDVPGFEDSLGFVQLRLGKLDDAIATFTRVLAASPIAASYLGRAIAYAGKGDWAKAEKDRADALKQDPSIEKEFAGYGLKLAAKH